MPLSVERLAAVLTPYVESGHVPGLVALVARGDQRDLLVLGHQGFDGPAMTEDSLFRIASITKPITAAAAMMLVERGSLRLDAPVAEFLPELAEPVVLRSVGGPVDDTVPAERPITARDLLTFQAGHGFPRTSRCPSSSCCSSSARARPPRRARPPPTTGCGSWPGSRCCTSPARGGRTTPAATSSGC